MFFDIRSKFVWSSWVHVRFFCTASTLLFSVIVLNHVSSSRSSSRPGIEGGVASFFLDSIVVFIESIIGEILSKISAPRGL
ncbi:hypothetical protein D3C84_715140 [compost metagenome]